MSSLRSVLTVVALLLLILLAFPLLASLFGGGLGLSGVGTDASPSLPDTTPLPTAIPVTPATSTPPPTLTPTVTLTPTPTLTSTPTLTPTPTSTSTPTPTPTPTFTLTPTSTPFPRVYLLPFIQVFAVGKADPSASGTVLMYEGGSDVFEVLAVQGGLERLQTTDAKMNFWTGSDNVSPSLPTQAVSDFSVRGRSALVPPGSVFACAYNSRPSLAFGSCLRINGVTNATLIARIQVRQSSLYLADIKGAEYIVSAGDLVPLTPVP